jgi:hypothetical protein
MKLDEAEHEGEHEAQHDERVSAGDVHMSANRASRSIKTLLLHLKATDAIAWAEEPQRRHAPASVRTPCHSRANNPTVARCSESVKNVSLGIEVMPCTDRRARRMDGFHCRLGSASSRHAKSGVHRHHGTQALEGQSLSKPGVCGE